MKFNEIIFIPGSDRSYPHYGRCLTLRHQVHQTGKNTVFFW